MKTEFQRLYIKDFEKLSEKLKEKILGIIKNVIEANSLNEIDNLKKLAGYVNAYRIKIGDYRIGIVVIENTIVFVRVKHRKDIYKLFP